MKSASYNIGYLLRKYTSLLYKKGIEDAESDTLYLLARLLKKTSLEVYTQKDQYVNKRIYKRFKKWIALRAKRIPLAYIVGDTHFYNLTFKVTRSTFIPRQLTEELVELAIKTIGSQPYKVLDLATGSGCIAVTIAKYCPQTTVYATDISARALAVAAKNAQLNGVQNCVFIKSDLFKSIPYKNFFDLIISNPPYISETYWDRMPPENFYEPEISFYAGKDGLKFIELIIQQAPEFLKPNGYLMLEIGYRQDKKIKKLLENSGKFKDITFFKCPYKYNSIVCASCDKHV